MRLLLLFPLIELIGCSKEVAQQPQPIDTPETVIASPEPITDTNLVNNKGRQAYRIALTGNSHIAGLGSTIQTLVTQLTPNKTAYSETIGHGFLDSSIQDTRARQKLENGQWTHFILQGQKYSQSRSRIYSTQAAERWIANSKALAITPVLFPEHPQKGDDTEAAYVHGLHQNIVRNEMSCLAPVGLVWDRVLLLAPQLELHASDGNHASTIGRYLTALVFAEVITGQRVDSIELSPITGLTADMQLLLAQAVSETLYQHWACPE